MAHIVLVHGMAATGKSWFTLPDLLRARDHEVTVVDLPGHVISSPLEYFTAQFVKMADYEAEVTAALSDTESSVLIGHSMGGAVISHVAAKQAERVKALVYVTAMVPRHGETIGKIVMRTGSDMSVVREEFRDAGVAKGDPALGNQPVSPFFTPFDKGDDFAALPKHYVHCSEDKIIKPALQASFCADWGITSTATLETGHLPTKTSPDKLAKAIDGLIG